jgi:hypothetical protein
MTCSHASDSEKSLTDAGWVAPDTVISEGELMFPFTADEIRFKCDY